MFMLIHKLSVLRRVHPNNTYPILYLRRGGRKPAAARRASLFLVGGRSISLSLYLSIYLSLSLSLSICLSIYLSIYLHTLRMLKVMLCFQEVQKAHGAKQSAVTKSAHGGSQSAVLQSAVPARKSAPRGSH